MYLVASAKGSANKKDTKSEGQRTAPLTWYFIFWQVANLDSIYF